MISKSRAQSVDWLVDQTTWELKNRNVFVWSIGEEVQAGNVKLLLTMPHYATESYEIHNKWCIRRSFIRAINFIAD